MMYGNYNEGNYNEGNYSGNYGRRGVPGTGRGRYRGYNAGGYSGAGENLSEAQEHYGAYSEGKEQMNMGNYGAEGTTMKALDYMLKSVCQFMEMLQNEAGSQEEMQLIKKYARKIGEM